MKNTNIRGWIVAENEHNGFPATKKYIVFHPVHDGAYWEQFDAMEEVEAFCSVAKFKKWSIELL